LFQVRTSTGTIQFEADRSDLVNIDVERKANVSLVSVQVKFCASKAKLDYSLVASNIFALQRVKRATGMARSADFILHGLRCWFSKLDFYNVASYFKIYRTHVSRAIARKKTGIYRTRRTIACVGANALWSEILSQWIVRVYIFIFYIHAWYKFMFLNLHYFVNYISSLNRNQWNFTDFSAILISINKICTVFHWYNTLILINKISSILFLIKIAKRQWILINDHSYKYNTANQWIIYWFRFFESSLWYIL